MTEEEKSKKTVQKVNFYFPDAIDLRSGMSSIEMKRNSKGSTEIAVKIYNDSPEEAKEATVKIFNELTKKFPAD